jgi:TPR repeat protein
VEPDKQEAVKWFIRAARQGDKTAQHNLGLHYASLNDEATPETSETAEAEADTAET